MRLTTLGATSLLAPLLLLATACGDPDQDQADPAPTAQVETDAPAPAETEAEEDAVAHATADAKPAADKTPKPEKQPKPKPKPKPKPEKHGRTYLVTRIVDGDTIELGNGQTVRIVGIDTPERGQCGYDKASEHMAGLVLYKQVRLTISDENTDHYGRLLRYVDVQGGGRTIDAGLNQIRSGLAIARYDSRDGYGYHQREPEYIRSDKAVKQFACAAPAPAPAPAQGGNCHPGYSPCLPLVADLDCGEINGPVHVLGDDPYGLDRDGDGVGCDS
jgi:endonuclease YncB( thermonuclease family)